jgi:hypothetical protein
MHATMRIVDIQRLPEAEAALRRQTETDATPS